MKQILHTLLFLLLTTLVSAQSLPDSAAIVKQAKSDARHFKLNDHDYDKLKSDRSKFMEPYRGGPLRPGSQFGSINPMINPADMIRVKRELNKVDLYADFFKPSIKTTKDTALLTDSVYVQAFRLAAYKRTINRNTPIIITASVLGAIAVVAGFIVILSSIDFG